MASARNGYRLKVSRVGDLSTVVDGFKAEALRLLGRRYGGLVAADAVRRLDLHVLGRNEPAKGAGPLSDANDHLRRAYAAGEREPNGLLLDCRIRIILVGDAVLARIIEGDEEYRRLWEARKEVVKWGWDASVPRPRNVSVANWSAREVLWRRAADREGISNGLILGLIDAAPPILGWGAIRRYLPTIAERTAAIAAALPHEGGGRENDHLAKISSGLVRVIGRDDLAAYPTVRRRRPDPPRKHERESGSAERAMIDHADILQASDGRIFIAVPHVGLHPDDRVFVQIGDGHLSITQNAMQYGYIADAPRSATDLLRDCRTAILVEVETAGDRRLLRARHVAIVRDNSLSESVNRSLGRWRPKATMRGRGDTEIGQWTTAISTTDG